MKLTFVAGVDERYHVELKESGFLRIESGRHIIGIRSVDIFLALCGKYRLPDGLIRLIRVYKPDLARFSDAQITWTPEHETRVFVQRTPIADGVGEWVTLQS
jgi:hypothetical protein